VLYGFGESAAAADSFFAMRLPFAVAVVPGARESDKVLQLARQRQREMVLHLPLEPLNYPRVNPGPGTLRVTMSPRSISSTVRRQLDKAGAVSAVANHMGSLATQDMTMMTAIYRELRRRRIAFLHMTPAPGAVCKSLAADMGVDYAEPDALLDRETREDNTQALDARWNTLLREARDQGHLVVMARATPLLWRWLPQVLNSKRLQGVDIVPLASLLEKPGAI